MEEIIDDFCKKLHCSFIALDVERLNYARKMLDALQHKEIYARILQPERMTEQQLLEEERRRYSLVNKGLRPGLGSVSNSSEHDDNVADATAGHRGGHGYGEGEEEDALSCLSGMSRLGYIPMDDDEEDMLAENRWLGYFKGFQILDDNQDFTMNEHKKCIELTHCECNEDVDSYLRAGIRCFAIDLFAGTAMENQTLIVRLRESEIRVSTEIGFPVASTLYACLSPRLQYLGLLMPPEDVVPLAVDDEITLTTDRYWSTRGTGKRVYINARFLIDDVQPYDYLLVGAHIQLIVKSVLLPDRLRCVVKVGGDLRSRLPVHMPGRCNKFRISAEELEDITFAKEVGVNVLVSYTAGTKEYFDNLQECMRLLQCEKMRLCARVVINELRGADNSFNWVADCYDGLIVDLNERQPEDECENEAQLPPERPELLHICPVGTQLLERVYNQRKPIIMNTTAIAKRQLTVATENYPHIFLQPDKYIVRCERSNEVFYFDQLQSALFRPLVADHLAGLVHCDTSHTGSDSLARACVAAAHESGAACIIVDGITGRMAAKISHWRPRVPVLLVTPMKSASDFISMYHYVVMLYYSGPEDETYRRAVYKRMLLGLLYSKARKIMRKEQKAILVYSQDEGTKCPDKYLIYKFSEPNFPDHLRLTLFGAERPALLKDVNSANDADEHDNNNNNSKCECKEEQRMLNCPV